MFGITPQEAYRTNRTPIGWAGARRRVASAKPSSAGSRLTRRRRSARLDTGLALD
jgi:hypothetical protein